MEYYIIKVIYEICYSIIRKNYMKFFVHKEKMKIVALEVIEKSSLF